MCDQPNVQWIREADALLSNWCQQGKEFSSLDFKLALRSLGDFKVFQRDVSAYLRNRFESGAFSRCNNGPVPCEYTRKGDRGYWQYFPDFPADQPQSGGPLLGGADLAEPKTHTFYLRNAKNERAICITAVYHQDPGGFVKTAVGVSVWDGKTKYNRTFARDVAVTRAKKALKGANPGWQCFVIYSPLPKHDLGILLALEDRINTISKQRTARCDRGETRPDVEIVPGKLVRAVQRRLSAQQ